MQYLLHYDYEVFCHQNSVRAILPLMPHREGSTEKGDKEDAYCV